jgi:predicted amidophosphoribosyltransferase
VILLLHNRYRVLGGEERAVADLAWLIEHELGEDVEVLERDSAGLSAAERRANLAGTFALRQPAQPAPAGLLVLVDDVVTCGATLTEAASVLARARSVHAAPVLAAVVAATPRRDPASAREKPTVR